MQLADDENLPRDRPKSGAGQGRSLLAQTAFGMGWIVAWRMATRSLGLVSTLVLARLLTPGDFGLVALGTTFVIAIDTLSTLGVEDAVVREPSPSPAFYDTAFTLMALRSGVTAVLIGIAAVPIGQFFAEPRLAVVLWALAIGALIEGVGSIGVVDFRRDMAFDKEFVLQILPRVLSIVVTIGAALIWRSYWALVAGILTSRVFRSALSYQLHAWRPTLSLAAWRGLIGISAWSWATSMVELLRDRMDAFVIGRIMSPTAVGIYLIGEEVAALPSTEVVLPLCRAAFSGFAVARRTGEGLSEAFMRPVSSTFLLTLPAGLGISLVADPLVRVVVGAQWAEAVPVIQVMGAMGAVAVFGYVAGTLLNAHSMLRAKFTVTLICVVARLLMLIPLVDRLGVLGAAIGSFAGMLIEHSMFVVSAFRRFRLSALELLRRVWRVAASAAAMAVVLVSTGNGWTSTQGRQDVAWALFSAVALGAAVYVAALSSLWWLSGRPAGAEADLPDIGERVGRPALHRLLTMRIRKA